MTVCPKCDVVGDLIRFSKVKQEFREGLNNMSKDHPLKPSTNTTFRRPKKSMPRLTFKQAVTINALTIIALMATGLMSIMGILPKQINSLALMSLPMISSFDVQKEDIQIRSWLIYLKPISILIIGLSTVYGINTHNPNYSILWMIPIIAAMLNLWVIQSVINKVKQS